MISSMTGFASYEKTTASGNLILELRAVNHRYLELSFKLDENLRALEPIMREKIVGVLSRGKVECRAVLMPVEQNYDAPEPNQSALLQLAHLESKITKLFPNAMPLSTAEILRWPGVLLENATNQEVLSEDIQNALDIALTEFRASRMREGKKLADIIEARLQEMQTLVESVKLQIPAQIKSYQARLTEKLREALGSADEERIRQEVIVFAQKIDVDEELVRLGAHISEVKRVLAQENSAGKRLDFLMQELNREANTLGSKSVSAEVSHVSVTLKILIEQMREQIQNIE